LDADFFPMKNLRPYRDACVLVLLFRMYIIALLLYSKGRQASTLPSTISLVSTLKHCHIRISFPCQKHSRLTRSPSMSTTRDDVCISIRKTLSILKWKYMQWDIDSTIHVAGCEFIGITDIEECRLSAFSLQ